MGICTLGHGRVSKPIPHPAALVHKEVRDCFYIFSITKNQLVCFIYGVKPTKDLSL